MAKIRTLKGEFFSSEDVSGDLVLKTLTAGLICKVADDDGRFKASPVWIRGEVFSLDPVTTDEVVERLATLARREVIQLYEVDGKPYGAFLNWKRHQKVPPSRYAKSSYPPPPEQQVKRRHHASKAHTERMQGASTPQAHASSRAGVGREGIGEDRKNPPTPLTVLTGATATAAGGEDKNPKRGSWTHNELHQRAVDLLAWWAGISGHLDVLSPKQATLTQERAMEFATLPPPLQVITKALSESYAKAEEKPEFLYAPTLWRAAGQAEAEWLKQRPQTRTGGLEAIGRTLTAVAVGQGIESDPDD